MTNLDSILKSRDWCTGKEDPEGWDGEEGGRGDRDGEHL